MNVTECPQCGAPASQKQKTCIYCKSPFIVDSLLQLSYFDKDGVNKYIHAFKNKASDIDLIESSLGLGLCYLNIANYSLATVQFKKLLEISPEMPDAYYYLAMSIIKGRRIKILTLKEIKEIEELINTARELNSESFKYDLLMAAIKYDYYRTNGLKVNSPTDDELIASAINKGIDADEAEAMLGLVNADSSFTQKIRSLF